MSELSRSQVVWKVLRDAAETMPEKIGYICQGREISFREMDEITDRVASGLLQMGFKKGDRIGIIGLNQLEWLYTYFAAAKIGAAIVGLSIRYRDMELDYMINHSQARAIVTIPEFFVTDYVKFFDEFRGKIPSVTEFVFIGKTGFPGSFTFDRLLNADVDRDALEKSKEAVRPDDLMIIIYTSGTTGKPKGAAISHKSQLAAARAQAEHIRVTPDDLILLPLPFNHVGGITCGICSLLLGRGCCVLIPMFTPDEMIDLAVQYRPTAFAGVPTIHTLLLMNEKFKGWDKSSVRLVITGGSNAEPELLRQLSEAFSNALLMNLYGLSEASGAVIMSPEDSDFEHTVLSIGKTIGDFRARVIDMDGTVLPAGEIGELCIAGDCVVGGYFRMPEETAETIDREGWLHTGDMASIDEEGYVVLKGRKKEMYITGGFNVYPVEVENLLSKHPKVMMVAGIGVPDPVLGEVGRYYIVPHPGTEPTAEEIKEFCRQNLADYKVPKQVVFREQLPLTPLGKIMKSQLKENFIATGE
ncbi:MAG: AMP-binding protein [Deltaproteobacteria bacterium]|nr:AMP-binding protein [Deltaproteobacteria bacterium]